MVEIDLRDYTELLGGKVISDRSVSAAPLEPEWPCQYHRYDGVAFLAAEISGGAPVEISGLKVLNTNGEEQDGEYPFVR
ncbi:MAG: hypothetical protein ACLRPX_07230 [Ruthenibacterium sp.]